MSRIVVTTLGSLGDLHPYIALGLGLRDRGHDVTIATVEYYRVKIESLGLKFHPIRPDSIDREDPQMSALMMDLKNGTEWVIRDYILGSLPDTYIDLLAACQGADLLVAHEIIYAAPLVSEVMNIPWISGTLIPGAFFSIYDPFVMPMYPALAKLRGSGLNWWVKQFGRWVTRDWSQSVWQLRQELGLKPVGNVIIDEKFSPYLVLGLFSEVLGAPQSDWPNNVVVTGFTFYDGQREQEIAPELEDFLDRGAAPIVFTLGSAAVYCPGDFYAESVAAAKMLDRRAVLLIGDNPPPTDLPPSIIACKYAPYSQVFPKAEAIVHQGGIGTTAQGLRSGRPTIVMPYSHDQPDNAARVKRLGTSRTIPRDRYSALRVAQELTELLGNPSYATTAAEIGHRLQTVNGVSVACDAIEKQLEAIGK
jgi:rhamnosyltransferase subunit B